MKIPQHIAFIMDGNGRWAQSRGLPRLTGHQKGVDALSDIIRTCGDMGVKYATFYAFSSENWQRPQEEVSGLMGLFRKYFDTQIDKLNKEGIRLHFIGNREPDGGLPEDIRTRMEKAEKLTAENNRLHVCICLNYGGRQELVFAARQLASQVQAGSIKVDDITEDMLSTHLFTKDIPCPDLCIRTSGEQRISNFLLWQLAYAELAFSPSYWPDFGREELQKIITEFATRERRFGGLNHQAV